MYTQRGATRGNEEEEEWGRARRREEEVGCGAQRREEEGCSTQRRKESQIHRSEGRIQEGRIQRDEGQIRRDEGCQGEIEQRLGSKSYGQLRLKRRVMLSALLIVLVTWLQHQGAQGFPVTTAPPPRIEPDLAAEELELSSDPTSDVNQPIEPDTVNNQTNVISIEETDEETDEQEEVAVGAGETDREKEEERVNSPLRENPGYPRSPPVRSNNSGDAAAHGFPWDRSIEEDSGPFTRRDIFATTTTRLPPPPTTTTTKKPTTTIATTSTTTTTTTTTKKPTTATTTTTTKNPTTIATTTTTKKPTTTTTKKPVVATTTQEPTTITTSAATTTTEETGKPIFETTSEPAANEQNTPTTSAERVTTIKLNNNKPETPTTTTASSLTTTTAATTTASEVIAQATTPSSPDTTAATTSPDEPEAATTAITTTSPATATTVPTASPSTEATTEVTLTSDTAREITTSTMDSDTLTVNINDDDLEEESGDGELDLTDSNLIDMLGEAGEEHSSIETKLEALTAMVSQLAVSVSSGLQELHGQQGVLSSQLNHTRARLSADIHTIQDSVSQQLSQGKESSSSSSKCYEKQIIADDYSSKHTAWYPQPGNEAVVIGLECRASHAEWRSQLESRLSDGQRTQYRCVCEPVGGNPETETETECSMIVRLCNNISTTETTPTTTKEESTTTEETAITSSSDVTATKENGKDEKGLVDT